MWIQLEEQRLMRRKSKLEAELSVRRVDAELAVSLIRCAADFERDPSGEVAQLNANARAFLARALFDRIELLGAGHGNGRVIRVASLVPRQSAVAISSRLHYP